MAFCGGIVSIVPSGTTIGYKIRFRSFVEKNKFQL